MIKEGDILLVTIDTNEHTMDGKFRKLLEAEGVGLVKFSHKNWGDITPQHVNQWKRSHQDGIQVHRGGGEILLCAPIH